MLNNEIAIQTKQKVFSLKCTSLVVNVVKERMEWREKSTIANNLRMTGFPEQL